VIRSSERGESGGMKGTVRRDVWHETGEGGRKTVMIKAQPTNGYYCPSRKIGKINKPRFVRERKLNDV